MRRSVPRHRVRGKAPSDLRVQRVPEKCGEMEHFLCAAAQWTGKHEPHCEKRVWRDNLMLLLHTLCQCPPELPIEALMTGDAGWFPSETILHATHHGTARSAVQIEYLDPRGVPVVMHRHLVSPWKRQRCSTHQD